MIFITQRSLDALITVFKWI